MAYSEIIAMRIKEQCKKRNITINYLATISGLRQSSIENIITGRSKSPTLKTIHIIANTLNMTPAEFLDFPEMNSYYFE